MTYKSCFVCFLFKQMDLIVIRIHDSLVTQRQYLMETLIILQLKNYQLFQVIDHVGHAEITGGCSQRLPPSTQRRV